MDREFTCHAFVTGASIFARASCGSDTLSDAFGVGVEVAIDLEVQLTLKMISRLRGPLSVAKINR